jgi:hypothetical protein
MLVYRLLNPWGFAAGQLAVFQGASEVPISESYGSSEQRGKTANIAVEGVSRYRYSKISRFQVEMSPSNEVGLIYAEDKEDNEKRNVPCILFSGSGPMAGRLDGNKRRFKNRSWFAGVIYPVYSTLD